MVLVPRESQRRYEPCRRLGSVLILLLALVPATLAARAKQEGTVVSTVPVPLHYQLRWLDEVAPFLTTAERTTYLALETAEARTLFQREFWRARDPTRRTPLNESKERYLHHLVAMRKEGLDPASDRARVRLLLGPPDFGYQHGDCRHPREDPFPADCFRGPTFEVVSYEPTADREGVVAVLAADQRACRLAPERKPVRIRLRPRARCATEGTPQRVQQEVQQALGNRTAWPKLAELGLSAPARQDWLGQFPATISRHSAVIPQLEVRSIAATGEGRGRRQGDPALLELNAALVVPLREEWWRHGSPWRNLFVRGDLLVNHRLVGGWETRRTLFWRPEESLQLPIRLRLVEGVAQTIVIHVEDEAGELYETAAFVIRPFGEHSPPPAASVPPATPAEVVPPRFEIEPLPGLRLGNTEVNVVTTGLSVASVQYLLDGALAGQSATPPFSLDIDLGPVPLERALQALGYDEAGNVIARDEWTLNPGANRFRVRLVDLSDQEAEQFALRARAEVPVGSTLQRLELFEGDELVAIQPAPRLEYRRPESEAEVAGRGVAIFRVVAHLADGRSTSDTKLLSRSPIDEVDTDLVEVFASVRTAEGTPLTDLQPHEATVLEEGREHSLTHFERVENLPLNLVLLLDVSATMKEEIETVRESAAAFMESTVREEDRAALIAFSGIGYVAAPFTNDVQTLREASHALTAWGSTALWDSIQVSLYYLLGLEGKSALVLLSDGVDQASNIDFRAALEFAERTGIAVYTIGLGLPVGEDTGVGGEARRRLRRLAEQTGGRYYPLVTTEELPSIYRQIELDLRSQYLLVYESSGAPDPESYRTIQVRLTRSGAQVEAKPGYYP